MSNSTAGFFTSSVSSAQSVSSAISSAIASSSAAESSFSSAAASSVSSEVLSQSTVTVEPSSTHVVTSIVSASSAPDSTALITSVVTQTPTAAGESSLAPITVVVTSIYSASTTAAAASSASVSSAAAASSSSAAASLQNSGTSGSSKSSGLSTAGTTAIAVVVPVVVVGLLVLAGILFWKKRKQKKVAKEERRKEVEEYGYNPNDDPTLPVVAGDGSEMAEDHSGGYRGWGKTTLASTRKASTTLSGGHTAGQLSDGGSNPGGYTASPPNGSDNHSGDGLVDERRETLGSDDLAALGTAPVAGSHRNNNNSNNPDIHRGISNASSQYSAGNRSDDSHPSLGHSNSVGQAYSNPDMFNSGSYGFNQHGPYGDGTYGGSGADTGMPIVRDVSARRNTRIEEGGRYQQGNSGIAQNF